MAIKYVSKENLQEFSQKLNEKQKTIFAPIGAVGSPLMAETAAAMTDTTKIYVYTGDEQGYTAGNWYYYNGTAWTSGGIYNSAAVEVDATLTESGKAADAKAAGDAVRDTTPAVYTTKETEALSSVSRNMDYIWSVSNAASRRVKSLIYKFIPIQDGVPTPENPVNITGYAEYSCRIGRGNLYSGERETGKSISPSTGAISTSSGYQVTGEIPVSGMNSVRIQFYNSASGARNYRTAFYDSSHSLISWDEDSYAVSANAWKTFFKDIPSNASYMRISTPTLSPNYMIVLGDSELLINSVNFPQEAGTVYGGYLDITNGKLTVTMGEIASYNGETLPGKWVSSMDVYAEGTTPTIGAQVVYDLETPVTYDVEPHTVQLFEGASCILPAVPVTVGIFAEYARNDILTKSDIYTTLSISGAAADAGAVGALIAAGGWGSPTAEDNIPAGTYFISGNTLYFSTAQIAAGETILPGTNCAKTDIVAALNALNAAIS